MASTHVMMEVMICDGNGKRRRTEKPFLEVSILTQIQVGLNKNCDDNGLMKVEFFSSVDSRSAITHAQLAVDVLCVGAHCAQGDHQLIGDLWPG